jgi:hypothetical protein
MRTLGSRYRSHGRVHQGARLTAALAIGSTVTAGAVACGAAEGGGTAATVRDSAGVTIVEYAERARDTLPWAIASQPIVEIGAVEGDEAYQLTSVSGVRRLSDGRIVIADEGTQELRIYDPTGRHLVTTGRKGEGPGEFNGLSSLFVEDGDTLLAYDGNLKRVSVLTSEGTFERSFMLDFEQGAPLLQGRFADGTFLATRAFTFAPSDIDAVAPDSQPVYHFAADGALIDSTGRWLATEWYMHGTGGQTWASSLPFGRRMAVAVAPAGFYVASSGQYEIEWRDPAGTLRRILRITAAPKPVTGDDWERVKAQRLRDVPAQLRPRQERMLAEMPVPSTRPAFSALRTDPDGNLWVADAVVSSEDARSWTVFDSTGQMLGLVATPPGLDVREIGRDYILGVAKDELDVQHVRLYVLEKP